jgi:hypothetical protein
MMHSDQTVALAEIEGGDNHAIEHTEQNGAGPAVDKPWRYWVAVELVRACC